MTKAYSENRPSVYLPSNGIYGIGNCSRVSGPVAQEEPMGIEFVYCLGVYISRKQENRTFSLFQRPDYIVFYTIVYGSYTPFTLII